jgi:hypothetical protein
VLGFMLDRSTSVCDRARAKVRFREGKATNASHIMVLRNVSSRMMAGGWRGSVLEQQQDVVTRGGNLQIT